MEPKPFEDFQRGFSEYLQSLGGRTEATRRQRFLDLLRDFFGVEADELEKTLQLGGVGARVVGRMDALAGNVILEFKDELTAGKLNDARNQLLKYARALSSQGDSRRYSLIATDGSEFRALRWDGVSDALTEVTRPLEFRATDWRRAYYWLDDWVASKIKAPVRPSASEIASKLGVGSSAYTNGSILLSAEWANVRSRHQAAYQEWEHSIVFVYGSNLASEELFLRHTYISAVAKVLVTSALLPGRLAGGSATDEEVNNVLLGELFRRFGILNLGERDFFAWISETPAGMALVRGLLVVCARWDFQDASEDLMRSLYEELIDPEARHDLGEYYTPPWVARLIVDEALDTPALSVLDPACGSGTFLVAAIKRKVDQGRNLDQILDEVAGIDIHPVAVTVARASYLLAIRGLLTGKSRRSRPSFAIPVFLSDSIRPRDPRFRSVMEAPGARVKYYELTVTDEKNKDRDIAIPAAAVEGESSQVILDAVEDAVRRGTWESIARLAESEFERTIPDSAPAALQLLESAFETIRTLHAKGRNGIHVFLLRNYFHPTLLKERIDRVVGNPPWLALRYLKDPTVQRSIKEGYSEEKLRPIGPSAHLVTQLDVSPLFFARCAKRYLRPGGKIRFLLPRTVFNSDQFSGFRGVPRDLPFDRAWDFARVRPLFSVQCCAIGAVNGPVGRTMRDPIPVERWSGSLSERNESLTEARKELTFESTRVTPTGDLYNWSYPEQDVSLLEAGRSPYHSLVKNGATIYPYPLVFVDVVPDSVFGFDKRNLPVRTGSRALRQAKKPWNALTISGRVEPQFLYYAITGSEVLPFAHLPLPVAALPLVPNHSGAGGTVLDSSKLRSAGAPSMSDLFHQAEAHWAEGHREGQKKGSGSFVDQIDYRGKLSEHPLGAGYLVAIPTSARTVLACVLRQGKRMIPVNGESTPSRATIVECTNNYLFTPRKDEAYYLCSILNSDTVNSTIKAPVHRGLDTERHTYREPLAMPIPRFDEKNPRHSELARLGEECTKQAEALLSGELRELASAAHIPSKLAALRAELRGRLVRHLVKIDKITAAALHSRAAKSLADVGKLERTESYKASGG